MTFETGPPLTNRAKTLHLILKQTALLMQSASEDSMLQSLFLLLTMEEQEELIDHLIELNVECGRLLVKLGRNPRSTMRLGRPQIADKSSEFGS